jgi:sugar phosphate isomerase/epimerase
MDRRAWMLTAGATLGFGGLASGAVKGGFKRPLGVQLYTVRSVIKGHEDEVLRRIAEIGYTEVETTGRDPMDVNGPILTKYKLKPVSRHFDVVAGGPEKLASEIEVAKKWGTQYLVHPYVPKDQRGGPDAYRKLADRMNDAAQRIHSAGLTFAYHNHAFEFGGEPGQRAIDIFKERLDKKLVNFELDVFWVSVAGHDPVELLKEFKGRVPLVHLKDKAQGTPVQYNEEVPKTAFKEVGSGVLNFPEILRTAEACGTKHYFVEQDQTPGDAVDSLAKSYAYLRSVAV